VRVTALLLLNFAHGFGNQKPLPRLQVNTGHWTAQAAFEAVSADVSSIRERVVRTSVEVE
jgi:hypothetical protein